MYGKLAAVGLVPARETGRATMPEGITLAAFIDQYITARMIQKPNTLKNYNATKRALLDFFGEERLLADHYRGRLRRLAVASGGPWAGPGNDRPDGQAGAAILPGGGPQEDHRRKPHARREGGAAGQQEPGILRHRGGDREDHRGLPGCRVAVDRGPGTLRRPADAFGDVCLDVGLCRLGTQQGPYPQPQDSVPCGPGSSRSIPLFPELRPYLEAVFDAAEPGTTYVISRHRLASANLRTQLLRIMDRAGVEPWPRLFQNMRASRETELSRRHPLHVVTAWIGNSAPIAARHYLQVTDTDFDKAMSATQIPTHARRRFRRSNGRAILANWGKKQHKPLDTKGLCWHVPTFATVYKCILHPLGESNPCRRTENPMS